MQKISGTPNGATKHLKPLILDPFRHEAVVLEKEGFFFDSFFDSFFDNFFDSFYYRIQNPKKTGLQSASDCVTFSRRMLVTKSIEKRSQK